MIETSSIGALLPVRGIRIKSTVKITAGPLPLDVMLNMLIDSCVMYYYAIGHRHVVSVRVFLRCETESI